MIAQPASWANRDWTAQDVRDLIANLGTTQAGLARLLGVRADTVRQEWCRHGVSPKGPARAALSMLAWIALHNPPPVA